MNTLQPRPHIAFFSQTGSEIVDLFKKTCHIPSLIITNYRPSSVREIASELNASPLKDRLIYLPNSPTVEDYCYFLEKFDNPIITLHGWLRIVPEEVCSEYEIYNGHPGLITQHEELRGKDPQKKAYDLGLSETGSVIHRVIPEVDAGEVLMEKRVNIEGLDLSEIFLKLRESSLQLWIDFFKQYHIV